MPGPQQVDPHILTRTNKETHLFLLERRHPHRAQLASREQTGKPKRVPLVGLDPITRASHDVPRRANTHIKTTSSRAARAEP